MRGISTAEYCSNGDGARKASLPSTSELPDILASNVLPALETPEGINRLALLFSNLSAAAGFFGVRNPLGVGKGMEDLWGEVVGKGSEEGEVGRGERADM